MHAIAKRIYTTALLLFLIPLLIGHLLATRHRTSPGYQLSMRHKHDVSYPLCHAWEVFCKKKTGEDQQKLILQSKLFTSLFYFHSNICEKHRTPISRELTESIVRENGFKKSSKIPLKKNERFYSLIESANNKNFRIKPDSKAESKKEFKRAVNTIDFSNHRSKPKYGPAFPIPEINIDDIKTQTNQDGVDTASFDYPSINKNIGDLNILKNKPSIPQILIRPEKVDDSFKTYESTSTDKTDLLTKNLNADDHENLNIPQYNGATLYSFTTSPMRDLDLTNRKTDKGNPEIKNARDFFPLKINTNHAVVLTNLLSSSSPELVSVSVNQELLNGKTYLNTPHPSFINNKIKENESSTETNTSIASDNNQYNSINKDVIRNFSVGTHLLSTISVPLNAVTSENKTENGTTKNTLEINNRNNKFDAREPRPSIKQNNHISENSESINVKFTIDYGGSPNYRKQETSIPYNSKGLQSKDTLKWNSGDITRVKVNLATDLSTHANVIYQTPKYDYFNSLYGTTAEYKDKLDSADYRSNPQNVLSSKLNFEKDENELFETRENNGILLFPSKPYKVSDHLKGSYSFHVIPTLSSFNNFETISTNGFVSEIENSQVKTESLFLTSFFKNENNFDESYDYSIISSTKVYTDIINDASTTIHLDYETRIFNSKIHQNTEREYRDFPHSIESVNSELIINTKVEDEGYDYSIIHVIPTLSSFNETNFQTVSTNAFVSEIENSKLKTDSLSLTNFYKNENDFDEGYDYSIISPTKVYTDIINDASTTIHLDYETRIFNSKIHQNTERVYRDFPHSIESVNSELIINTKVEDEGYNYSIIHAIPTLSSFNEANFQAVSTNAFVSEIENSKLKTDSLSLTNFYKNENDFDEGYDYSIISPTKVYTDINNDASTTIHLDYETRIFNSKIHQNTERVYRDFLHSIESVNSELIINMTVEVEDSAKDSATQSVQHSPKSPFENKISQSFKVNNDNTIYSNNENNIKRSFSFERNSFGAENIVLSSVIKTTDLKSELLFPTQSYYNTEDNNKMPMSSAFKYFKTPTKTANTFSFSKIRSSINSDDYFYKSYTNYKESEYYSTSSHLVLFTESREYTFAPMQTENYLKFRTEREIESSSDGQHHFITEISSGNEIRKTAIDTEATEQGIENSLSRNPTIKTNNSYNRQISMTERNLGAREYKIQASAVNHLNVDKTNYADDQIIRTKKYLEATEREIEISAANDHDLYVKNSSADHNIRTEIDFEGTEQEVRTLVASDSNVYYESTPDKQILRTETDFETTEQEFKFLPADDQNVDDGNSSDEEIVRTERDLNAIEREEKTSPDDDQNIDDGNSSDEEIVRTERDLNSVEREEKTSPDDDQNMNVKKPSDDEFVTEKYLETENALNPTININVDVELNSEPVIQPGVEYVPSVEYVSQPSGSTNTLESNENPILTINRKPETIGSNLGISTEFQIGSDFDISSQTVPGELHKTAGTIIPNVNLEISKPIYGIDSTLGIKNNVDAQVSGGININGEGVTVDTNFKVSKAGSDFNPQLLPEELRNTASISIPSVNLDISPAKNSYGIDSKLGIGNSVNIQVGGGINLDGNGVSLDTDVKLGEDSSNINGNIDINLASDPSAQRSSSPENRGSSVNEMSANEESVTEETLLSNEVSIAPSTKLFDENKVTTQVILPSITKQIPMADTPEIILNSNDEDEDISYQATEVINAENTISTIISTKKLIPIEATENVPDAQKAETTNYKNILSTTSTGNVFNSEASTESLSPSVPSNVVLNSAPGRNQRDSESSVTTSRVQSTVAATTEIPVIPFHFTIDADYDEVVGTRKTEFEESLTKQLGVAMRVPLNCIQNLEVKKGSIEVNFDLSPNSDHGHLADEKALKAAAEELKRLIDNGQLNVNDLNGNTMVVVPLDPPTKPPPTNSMEHTTLILGVIIGAFILIVIVVAITAIIVKRKSIEDQNRLTPIEEARSKLPSYREIQFQEALFMKGPKGQQKLMFGKYCYNTGQWVGPGPEPMLFQAPESVVYRPPTDSEIRQTPRPPTSVRERLKQNWEVDWDSMVSSR
ncbi:hypothetical protein JTE90_025747 [Oedothorax gibbosus]|uniref:Uncharacterized protein n=1 Tax=Oedothorax gibbosus TaxID=931172 RepID=A0AAV6UUW0_9ARAC|nr:hypothetical protein JTE90_025747 [Oedothorax gibbosus]